MAPRKAFLLRINPALWEELERWAAAEFRSVNGKIEYLLQRAVQERNKGTRGRGPEARQSEAPPPEAPPAGAPRPDAAPKEGREKS